MKKAAKKTKKTSPTKRAPGGGRKRQFKELKVGKCVSMSERLSDAVTREAVSRNSYFSDVVVECIEKGLGVKS